MHGATMKTVNAQQAKLNNYKNTKLKLLKTNAAIKCDFSKEHCSSLKMILGSKHVGAILNVLMYKQFYVCALVGVLIKCLYEMHGATIKNRYVLCNSFLFYLSNHKFPSHQWRSQALPGPGRVTTMAAPNRSYELQ